MAEHDDSGAREAPRKPRVPYTERIGSRFGRLTVLGKAEGHKRLHLLCRCDCGREKAVQHTNLASGNTTSCGCLLRETIDGQKGDPVGGRFGRWTVLAEAPARTNRGGSVVAHYLCRCECGTEREVAGMSLRRTKRPSRSCGCALVESGRRNGLRSVADKAGKTYGLLTVLRRVPRDRPGHALWECRCACGRVTEALSCSLTTGNTASCGCAVGKWNTPEERLAAVRLSGRVSASRRRAAQRLAHKPFDALALEALERDLHKEAVRLTAETGVVWTVDHIVPLVGPWSDELGCRVVCGLHNEHNLRVMPRLDNISKGNRWWPGMPGSTQP